jgi:hypothetical protein
VQSGRSPVHRPRDELLAQAAGVRMRVDHAKATPGSLTAAFVIEDDWVKGVRRWFSSVGRGLGPYLQEQYEVLPTIAYGLPPDTGKPDTTSVSITANHGSGRPWRNFAHSRMSSV